VTAFIHRDPRWWLPSFWEDLAPCVQSSLKNRLVVCFFLYAVILVIFVPHACNMPRLEHIPLFYACIHLPWHQSLRSASTPFHHLFAVSLPRSALSTIWLVPALIRLRFSRHSIVRPPLETHARLQLVPKQVVHAAALNPPSLIAFFYNEPICQIWPQTHAPLFFRQNNVCPKT
jgi:hypothetical protein